VLSSGEDILSLGLDLKSLRKLFIVGNKLIPSFRTLFFKL
jgi:hypothetical protein